MGIYRGDIMKVDFNDKDAVIKVAQIFGPGQTVFRRPACLNYNITHTSRTDQYEKSWVVYQTGDK